MMIEIAHVHKTFTARHRQVHALHDVSLSVDEGDIYGIVGYSGAGKSTLLRMVNGLETPDSGSVNVDGVEIASASARDLRKLRHRVGMIFQNYNLLGGKTVWQNIALALQLQKADKKYIAEQVNYFAHFVGLEGMLDAKAARLSGGQKQRVAIARALSVHPTILLADEATSALDPTTTTQILELLARVNQELGVTILAITHHMGVVRKICNKMAVMSDGHLVESGEVEHVITAPKHEVTKQFLSSLTHERIPHEVLARVNAHGRVYRLVFSGKSAYDPLLSRATRGLGVEFSILAATVNELPATTIGILVVGFSGDAEAIQATIDTLRTSGVHVQPYESDQEHIWEGNNERVD